MWPTVGFEPEPSHTKRSGVRISMRATVFFSFELLDKNVLWNSEFAFEAIIKNSEFDILRVRLVMETETHPSRNFINLTTVGKWFRTKKNPGRCHFHLEWRSRGVHKSRGTIKLQWCFFLILVSLSNCNNTHSMLTKTQNQKFVKPGK